MKPFPGDQQARERFAAELHRNFSVVAAAGTGKTAAIAARIAKIAQADAERIRRGEAPEALPRLVVVTFTNRAADEMQQRARQQIFERRPPLEVVAAFNQAFFGTIHSFCAKLLAQHGHYLGLPSRLEVVGDDQQLWNDFVQETASIGESLSPENRRKLFRHVALRELLELARLRPLPLFPQHDDSPYPRAIDIHPAITYRGSGDRIKRDKERLQKWKELLESSSDFVPLIEPTSGATGFGERWEGTFRKLNRWLSDCALKVAAEIQAKYRQFRVERGVVTFDDQIAFALQLIENRETISRIRARNYIVILDEAQDTDPQQFDILTEITRPPAAEGRWIETQNEPPGPGRFCMVGDFQQSIYGTRADLKHYQRVHRALVASDAGEELKFSVTFRLDREQIDFVNKCFPSILTGCDGQVTFIPLEAHPETLPGQVIRLDVAAGQLPADASEIQKARAEAAQLARWIKETNLENFRARSWDQVAILSPRRRWLGLIANALRAEQIDSQIHSEIDLKGDSPAHAWFTALLTIMTQPWSSFEIVGVLREVFGISDHDLATFAHEKGGRFQIQYETQGSDVVSKTLNLLAAIHAEILDKPLFTAVARMAEATQLRERLQKLPSRDFDDLDREVGVLVQAAASAEAEGQTLEDFAERLRADFAAPREATAPRRDAIQLITCQKAKGLEWDAVIVPFFCRKIYTSDDNFPRVLVVPQADEVIAAFGKSAVPAHARDAIKQAQRREMERILYVAMTRARHTLVLAADRALFAKADGTAPDASLMKWFRSDQGQENASHLAGLKTRAAGCRTTREHHRNLAHREDEAGQSVSLPSPALDTAIARASDFLLQLNPSEFLSCDPRIGPTDAQIWKETDIEFRARTLPSAATRYGVWWHELMRKLPWHAEPAMWQAIFDESLASSPDSSRSKHEWQLFNQYVVRNRDFFAGNILTEMPFFWRINDRECLEGVVDLACFNPLKKQWLLLDWKTNQITPGETDRLRLFYLPQMAAYSKAVAEVTKQPVSTMIYSTATGRSLFYDAEQLDREWERLRALT